MNDCPLNFRIDAYRDGELDAAERMAFDRHLAACGPCSAELAQLSDLSGWFAAMPRPHLSQISRHRLHRTLDGVMEEGLLRVARYIGAMAACVLVGSSIWLARINVVPPEVPDSTASNDVAMVSPPRVQLALDEQNGQVASLPAAAMYPDLTTKLVSNNEMP